MRRLALLGLVVIASSCGTLHRVAPAGTTIPWAAHPAMHLSAPTPAPTSAVPQLPVPAGTPPCQPDQLDVAAGAGNGAGGHVDSPVIFRNRSAAACFLSGYPDIEIDDAAGNRLAGASGTADRGTFFPESAVTEALLLPGTPVFSGAAPFVTTGQAYVNVEWADCSHPQAATMLVTLPAGGQVRFPYPRVGSWSAVCDGNVGYRSLSRGHFSPAGPATMPEANYWDLRLVLNAPRQVRRGAALDYTVAVTDADARDFDLAVCPDYREFMGQKHPWAEYQLNCGPVSSIRSGETVVFAMRLQTGSATAVGDQQLTWLLQDARVAPSAFPRVAVTVLP